MKIELYLIKDEEEGMLIKAFLENNKLPFKIIEANMQEGKSSLKITYSHAYISLTGLMNYY